MGKWIVLVKARVTINGMARSMLTIMCGSLNIARILFTYQPVYEELICCFGTFAMILIAASKLWRETSTFVSWHSLQVVELCCIQADERAVDECAKIFSCISRQGSYVACNVPWLPGGSWRAKN